jgi:hypothetical protein
MARTASTLFLGALLSACASRPPVTDGRIHAGIGQTAELGGIAVTPIAVLEDSRCPRDVQCPWAGRVRINARTTDRSASRTQELALGEPVPVAGGKLELVEVEPEARAQTPIPAGDYRFGFRLIGGI